MNIPTVKTIQTRLPWLNKVGDPATLAKQIRRELESIQERAGFNFRHHDIGDTPMTTQHTPGPWDREHVSPRITNIVSHTPEKSIVCSLDVPEHGSKLANARLIAAAPDMLQALTTITVLSHLIPQPANHDGLQLADAIAQARAAIAAATGPRQ